MQFIDFPPVPLHVQGLEEVRIPRMVRIRQKFDPFCIEDVYAWTEEKVRQAVRFPEQYRGKRIAVTAGSRGIPQFDRIIRAIIDVLKSWGADPFIVPAMGSHGGATAEGQTEILAGYNIKEESMGCPVLSSMEVVEIGTLEDGTPVYCDKYAFESDGIVVVNKVKPHTDFRAEHESGLAKMMAIGLGKHKGAAQFHAKGFSSFPKRIPQVCDLFIKNAPIAFGVGIVQNAYDKISNIEAAEKDDILDLDAKLLVIAKEKMACFKVNNIDVLIVDRIGKNISGNGHDPNITGRSSSPGFDKIVKIQKMFIRGLTEESHHNGSGIYCADVTTRRCVRDIDFETMWTNNITATILRGGQIPIYTETDKEALMLAIRTCNDIDYANPRVVRILDTLHMEEIEVSEAFLEECGACDEIEVLTNPEEMKFDSTGFLI